MDILVRQEMAGDYAKVYEVNRSAFGRDNESRLVELLRKSDAFVPELSLAAIDENEVVGHILFTKIKIRDEKGNEAGSLALAPMAVKPEFQNQGIGGKLIHDGLKIAADMGFKSVIVLGHKNYYPKFGFKPAAKWNIRPPFSISSDVFMGIELENGALAGISGVVQYPKEFEMVT